MNKVIVTIICIIVILGAMFTAIMISKPNDNEIANTNTTKVADENILDDCTEEYEEMENKEMLEANSNEEKISPNCSFSLKTYYKGCKHTKNEYLELPDEIVNMNKQELQNKYNEWSIEKFASNEIILYKEADGECGEHYLVKEDKGKVVIYRILEDGSQREYERTEISIEYLTDTDKTNIEEGIKVNGKQELNQLIEDFE